MIKLKGLIEYRHTKKISEKTIREYYNAFRKQSLDELFDKPAKTVTQTSPITYLVSDKDIEAEYRFRKDEDDSWTVHWKFTNNNIDTSSSAWIKVTGASFKVIKSFLDQKSPNRLTISGDTQSKTNVYKSQSFAQKLQDLFGQEYFVTYEDFSIVMTKKEISHRKNIESRMMTMNESYDQALKYWKYGDEKTLSRIEHWNNIKTQIRRDILESLYL